ncbi:MAG: AraC family transcriptional regulator [Clostridia bacterium]|nr:AraC family transcriptional regulator [Clostridia bacterium]
MDFLKLNPYIREFYLYERKLGGGMRRTYDARAFYILSGGITLEIEGQKKHRLSPGAFFYLPAGATYKLKSEGARFILVRFDFYYHGEIDYPSPVGIDAFVESQMAREEDIAPFGAPLVVEDMADMREELLSMAKIFSSESNGFRARCSAQFKRILIRLSELDDEGALPYRMTEALDDYIRENAGDDLSNTEIGAVFGYHPFYISQMLKKKKGITLKQYIIGVRLRMACDLLLHTDKTVIEIADLCAFTDSSYFTKAFKAQYGMTPKAYRTAHTQEMI